MTMPHVAIVNVLFSPNSYGGATIVAEEVAQSLFKRGWKISVISLISRADLVPYSIVKSEVSGIESYLINIPQGRRFVETYNNPMVGECIAGLLDQIAPDLMHVHCVQDVGANVVEIAKSRDLPVILSIHDFWWICERQFMIRPDQQYCGQAPVCLSRCRSCVDDPSASLSRRDFLFRQASMADVVTYPSRFARNLCETSGLAPGSGAIWENGVRLPDPQFFDLQADRRQTDNRIAFGYLGGPAHIKGWPDIKRAFGNLKRDDFHVHLVDGGLDHRWWDGIDLSNLPGNWIIQPRFAQDKMDQFYAKIDVLLFMSQWKETFGLAIREAQARGITVIQTDSGGTIEHARAQLDQLIPIGAGHKPLQHQIETILNYGLGSNNPINVTSFDDQAEQFIALTSRVLNRNRNAA